MAKGLYLRLAVHNLKHHRRMYLPFLVATVIMSSMCFIIYNLAMSRGIANLSYGPTMQILFQMGMGVMDFFIVGYMLYINSFLIKRRKKEFGLYGILGLEKRHVGRIIFWENVLMDLTALVLGLFFGILFGKLITMLLVNLMSGVKGSSFDVAPAALLVTAAIFAFVFVLTTIYNLFQVRLSKPIDLLSGEKRGEKKVRCKGLMTLVGTLMLGAAYAYSITTRSSTSALLFFWPLVLMVILATWLLFTGGSAFVLERLRKNRRFYYKAGNFISVSGLIHRMKQNAAGLANICVLSSMVLVTVSCCCSMFFGQGDILAKLQPNDLTVTLMPESEGKAVDPEQIEMVDGVISTLMQEHALTLESKLIYPARTGSTLIQNERLVLSLESLDPASSGDSMVSLSDSLTYIDQTILTQAAYSQLFHESLSLNEGEMMILLAKHEVADRYLFGDEEYRVIERRMDSPLLRGRDGLTLSDAFLVVRDEAAADTVGSRNAKSKSVQMVYQMDGRFEDQLAFEEHLKETLSAATSSSRLPGGYGFSSYARSRDESNAFYGGLIFLGAFFTLLFLTNTVLIIYFKQISEGMDDHARFEILQKVGMDDREVRRTINRQVLIVFFLPLAMALIHVAAASNLIIQMLRTFSLNNASLTLHCVWISALVFILVYILVFRITARVYYKLVKW